MGFAVHPITGAFRISKKSGSCRNEHTRSKVCVSSHRSVDAAARLRRGGNRLLIVNSSSWAIAHKNIVSFEGVRDNMLVGYGLVVGLNGTGDSLSNAIFTKESLIGMLERLGVASNNTALKTDNVAAVMATATLPPFAGQRSRIDVTISALGDASSLLGGTLLVTPLLGADGEVYAVSQGSLVVGGFAAEGLAETVTKGVPTSGRIPGGAIIERELPFVLANLESMKLSLRNPDFTTARRVARVINAFIGVSAARPIDPASVVIKVPANYEGEVVELITDIEQLRVEPDQIAKVVIDEQSGVIVMGENVRINTVAIAQGNLTIRITDIRTSLSTTPFSTTGTTTTVQRTTIEIEEQGDRKLAVLSSGVTAR